MTSNDLGLDGIEFIEFSSPDPKNLQSLFEQFGFVEHKENTNGDMKLYRQGEINIIVNQKEGSYSQSFYKAHGPCVSSMAWRVGNAEKAVALAVERGATAIEKSDYQVVDGKPLLGIMGIGGSIIYFVDNFKSPDFYEKIGFVKQLHSDPTPKGMGFLKIDHLTNNVPKGEMAVWSDFYKNIFGFSEIRYFDIRGVKTGLTSYALQSPCKNFCIPINEGTEEKSQINEYLREYKGPGVQHIAFTTDDIVSTISSLAKTKIQTLDIDQEYYDTVFDRVPNVSEDHKVLQDLNILIDGDDEGYLLQIFTKNIIGPIFIEIIQRKNHNSFGEGNFGALFRSIERDQEHRGVL